MPAPRLLTPTQIIIVTGGAYILITSTPGSTLTCGADSYTLGSAETSHAFEVDAGTYTCTATLSGYTTASQNVTVSSGVVEITLKPYLLPAEYQQVQWLKTDGVAYILNSALGLSSNYSIDINIYLDAIYYSEGFKLGYIFGANGMLQVALSENQVSIGNANTAYNWVTGLNYKISIIANTIYINDTTTGLSRSPNASSNYLFWNGSNSFMKFGTIRSVVKYNSAHDTVLNCIPCYRKLDSVPGFYDIINNQFYANSGSSGSFIVGEDVN